MKLLCLRLIVTSSHLSQSNFCPRNSWPIDAWLWSFVRRGANGQYEWVSMDPRALPRGPAEEPARESGMWTHAEKPMCCVRQTLTARAHSPKEKGKLRLYHGFQIPQQNEDWSHLFLGQFIMQKCSLSLSGWHFSPQTRHFTQTPRTKLVSNIDNNSLLDVIYISWAREGVLGYWSILELFKLWALQCPPMREWQTVVGCE